MKADKNNYELLSDLSKRIFALNEYPIVTLYNSYQAYVGTESGDYFIEITDVKDKGIYTDYFWEMSINHIHDDFPFLEKIKKGRTRFQLSEKGEIL